MIRNTQQKIQKQRSQTLDLNADDQNLDKNVNDNNFIKPFHDDGRNSNKECHSKMFFLSVKNENNFIKPILSKYSVKHKLYQKF